MKLTELTNVLPHEKRQTPHPDVLYHITLKKHLNSIASKGLSAGTGNKNYQYNTAAVFLVDNYEPGTLERIGSIVLTGSRSEQDMDQLDDPDLVNQLVLLAIDMTGYEHPVYVDNVMKLKGCYYTTSSIEPQRISVMGKIDFIDLNVVSLK